MFHRALRDRIQNKIKLITEKGEEVMNSFCLFDTIVEDIKGNLFHIVRLIFIMSLFTDKKFFAVKSCFVTTLERAKLLANGKIPKLQPPAFRYRIDGSTVIDIESIDRELPFETLFEQDNDQMSLSTMILDSILKVSFYLFYILENV